MPSQARRASDFLRERLGPDLAELGAALGARVGDSAARLGRLLGQLGNLVDDVAADSAAVAREAEKLRDAAFERSANVRDAIRVAPRFARILSDALLLVAAYRIHAAASGPGGELLGDKAVDTARERLHREGARRLYRLCVDLRGGVLKIGQFASSRIDLLPAAYARELSRLQDRVPPVPTTAIQASIAGSLGAPLETLFSEFTAEPLAAASLAQVHGARLHDGTPVAVKALVPGIEDVVETDLAALRVVAPALREFWPNIDGETIARELGRSLRAELDLEAEADSAERFARECAEDDGVIVPRIHRAASARRVLTLGRIEGARLPDWLEACGTRGEAGQRDRDRLLGILVRTTSAQILRRGFCHADPHPGNFLVVEGALGPRLAVLDFGCVLELSAQRRRAWAQLVLAGVSRDVPRVVALLEELGFRTRGDAQALEAFATRLVEAVGPGGPLAPGSVDADARLRVLLALLHESPIVEIPRDAVLLGRVMASLGGILVAYRPTLDLFRLVAPDLLRAAGGA
jgi:ubiquinone biosynthesis protein